MNTDTVKDGESAEQLEYEKQIRLMVELVRNPECSARLQLIELSLSQANSHNSFQELLLDELWERGDPVFRCIARALTASKELCLRDQATMTLGRVGTSDDLECLSLRLIDHNWVVRASAASSIGSIGTRQGFELLRRRWKKENHFHVRRYIAVALLDADPVAAIPILQAWRSTEKDDEALVGILLGLALHGDESAFEDLLLLCGSSDHWVAALAVGCLGDLLEERCLNQPEVARAIEAATRLTSHPVRMLSSTAEEVVEKYGSTTSSPAST